MCLALMHHRSPGTRSTYAAPRCYGSMHWSRPGAGTTDSRTEETSGTDLLRLLARIESLSLGQFHLLGFPVPRQQVEFVIDGRRYRVDFFFEEADAIGEADGRNKYGPDVAGPEPEARLWAEKDREDDLRSVVRGFARWGWDHALGGHVLAQRLKRAGVHPRR